MSTLVQEIESLPLEARAVFWGERFLKLIDLIGVSKEELTASTRISMGWVWNM